MDSRLPEEFRRWLTLIARRWALIATTLCVSITGAIVYNYSVRPVYRATATLLIDSGTPDVLPGKEVVVQRMTLQYLNTQLRILESRNIAEKVVRQLELHTSPELKAGPMMSPWERFRRSVLRQPIAALSDLSVEAAAVVFQTRVEVQPVPDTNLVSVGFKAYDPVVAALAANTLSQAFVKETSHSKQSSTVEASGWLEERIKEQQAKVQAADRAVQDFRKRQGGGYDERDTVLSQRVASLNAQIMAVRSERISKESLYQQLQGLPPARLLDLPALQSMPVVQSLRTRINELRRERTRLGESLGDKHPDMVRLQGEIDAAEERLANEAMGIVRGLQAEVRLAQQQEDQLQTSLAEAQKEASGTGRQSVEYSLLRRELEISQQLLQQLMRRAQESELETTLESGNVRVIEKAGIPGSPFTPNRMANIRFAIVAGLALGLLLAFAADQLDNTFKTPDDVKECVEAPFLGVVPETTKTSLQADAPASVAEAYRVIRTNIQFAGASGACRVLAVTSAGAGEGKSTTTHNLAVTLAQSGARVAVVDGDLRRPTQHRHFRSAMSPGLSEAIVSPNPDAVKGRATGMKGVDLLASGVVPPNPTDLISAAGMAAVLTAMRAAYDYVLVDTPPVLGMADTPLLARLVDGVVLVVAAEKTAKPSVSRAVEQIGSVGGRVAGTILNRVDLARNAAYYSTYYGEYYRSYRSDSATEARAPRPASSR